MEFALALVIALVVFFIVVYWCIFEKAGHPGWAALIPIYNIIVLFKVAGMSPWWILACLLGFIPIVGSIISLVINVMICIGLGKAFGRGTGFIIGLIFLPFIFMPILAFDDSRWNANDSCE